MRKVYYTKKKQPILASGIIPIYQDNLILQYEYKERANTCYLVDFGGKIDLTDSSPFKSAIRELIEETNGYLFNQIHNEEINDDIKKYYSNNFSVIKKPIYIEKSKYMLYFVEIDEDTFNKFLHLTEKFNELATEGLSHQIVVKQKIADDSIKLHPRLESFINNNLVKDFI